ncbi:hypothetical protein [Elizabethkingia anophelis]|uniref:hypothetical protein n=1 Tax=Elizabethkingia anophelis TaxID=1117645 RepID=UPI0024E1F53F|nr:hypothetical protein [Elizabethkingia anophelis]MCT3761126.1 hypothetical protein [Elizabethkingia anophelis]CAI9682483.1 hypothetical protein EAVVTKC53_02031 [Elizabethkingia anophelis]
MRKKILFAPLWGIFALSLLSSCRTEDGAITQKQIEDKRFNVFVSMSPNEKVDYANGFAYLMKRADELHKSNISGINNKSIIGTLASAGKNTSAFQDTESYVEFNIRSEMTTEKNGDKWLVFPKVQGNKVIALVLAYLSKQETKVNYYTYGEQHAWFKENVLVYQNALNKLQKRNVLSLNASIKPMAGEGLCPPETIPDPLGGCMRIKDIDGVTITVPAPADSSLTSPDGGPAPSYGNGGNYGCEYYNSCYPTPPLPTQNIDIEQLKNYPCAYALAKELPNLNNELANALNKIFKNSDKYNITFKAGMMSDADDGYTRSAPKKEVDKFYATITLNDKMLSSATKEYILITMYHEVIHAYLGYELMQLGDIKFREKYPMYLFYNDYDSSGNVKTRFTFKEEHTEFGSFMDTLTNVITSYNSSKSPNNPLPAETIKAMVKSGVTSLSPTEKDLNERERGFDPQKYGNPNGTKCP